MRIHAAPAIPGRFDAHRVVEVYRETAHRHGVRIPDAFYCPDHNVLARGRKKTEFL